MVEEGAQEGSASLKQQSQRKLLLTLERRSSETPLYNGTIGFRWITLLYTPACQTASEARRKPYLARGRWRIVHKRRLKLEFQHHRLDLGEQVQVTERRFLVFFGRYSLVLRQIWRRFYQKSDLSLSPIVKLHHVVIGWLLSAFCSF